MTTVFEDTVKCACCDSENVVELLGSTNTFGYSDLDTRPPEMQRSTMRYWLMQCSQCGYVNDDISSISEHEKEVVSREEYANISYENKLAEKFMRRAYIDKAIGENIDAFYNYLHSAWAFDDFNETDNARSARLKCIEILDDEDIEGALIVIKADILRRAGLFDRLVEEYSDFESSEEIFSQIVDYQIELAKKQDDSCHSVEEIYK